MLGNGRKAFIMSAIKPYVHLGLRIDALGCFGSRNPEKRTGDRFYQQEARSSHLARYSGAEKV